MMHDLQKDLAKKLYGLINPGSATKFAMAWPSVRNYQTLRHIGQSAVGALRCLAGPDEGAVRLANTPEAIA